MLRTDRRVNSSKPVGITRRLMARGHRRIAYLTACYTEDHRFRTPANINTGSVRRRIEGFLSVCIQAGSGAWKSGFMSGPRRGNERMSWPPSYSDRRTGDGNHRVRQCHRA
jgi:hypothetical protein